MIRGLTALIRSSVCAFLCALLAFPATLLAPPPPAWWAERGATDPTRARDDSAAANIGQLKHFASKAYEELEAKLSGGAGPALTAMISPWFQPDTTGTRDDFAAVNLGQLKYVAKPFYDRLIAIGFTNGYPWTGGQAEDFAVANLGQLKKVFSFDTARDSDADGLPDVWELSYLGTLAKGAGDSAGLPGGQTLLQAFEQGVAPNFYGDELPTLTIVSGDHQGAEPGLPLAEPLVVLVTNTAGSTYQNVSMYFSTTGGGLSTEDASSSISMNLQVRTNAQGKAVVSATAPDTEGPFQVTAGTQAGVPAPGGNRGAAASAPASGGASISFSAMAGHASDATFQVASAWTGFGNPALRQYDDTLPIEWFLRETSDSTFTHWDLAYASDLETHSHASYHSIRTVHPLTDPDTFSGHSEIHDTWNGIADPTDTSSVDAIAGQSSNGSWYGNLTSIPPETTDGPIYLPAWDGYFANLINQDWTTRTYFDTFTNNVWDETSDGSTELSHEYTRSKFAADVIARLPPNTPTSSMSNIAGRYMASDGSSFSVGRAVYTLQVSATALQKRYEWYEVWLPSDDLDTPTIDESQNVELTLKHWDYDGTSPVSSEFSIDPKSKGVNGYWSLLPVDIDVVHPVTGEESETREATEGGYVAIRKDDQTPVTKLRLHQCAGLPSAQFKLSWSSAKIRLWKDEQRTQAVTSNQTTFPANVDTDVFLEGVSKSDAAKDVEVGMKVVIGTTESSPIPVKLTVVQSEYNVTVQAFIPYRWVDIPLNWFQPFPQLDRIAGGDNRNYDSSLSRTFRARETFVVTPHEDLTPGYIKAGSVKALPGDSIHYKKSVSVPAGEQSYIYGWTLVDNPTVTGGPSPGTNDIPTAGNVQVVAKHKFTFQAHMAAYEGVIGQNAEPIVWNLNFGFDVTNPIEARVLLDGTRKGFPAYEMYIRDSSDNNLPIYQWSPPGDRGVGSLFLTEPITPPNQPLELRVP